MGSEFDNVRAIQQLEDALLSLGDVEAEYILKEQFIDGEIFLHFCLENVQDIPLQTFYLTVSKKHESHPILFYQKGTEYIPIVQKNFERFADLFMRVINHLDGYGVNVRIPLLEYHGMMSSGVPLLSHVPDILTIAKKGGIHTIETVPESEEGARTILQRIMVETKPEEKGVNWKGRDWANMRIQGMHILSNFVTNKGERPLSGIQTYTTTDQSARTLRDKIDDILRHEYDALL